jgi:hypothetical protein
MKRFLLPTLVVCLTVGAAAVSNPASSSAAVIAIPIAYDNDEDNLCDLICGDGDAVGCQEGWHDAWRPQSDPDAKRGGGAHSPTPVCYEGTCEERHPACTNNGFAAIDFEEFRFALAAGDIGTAVSLIAEHPENLIVNTARHAVQVVNCSGAIIAHLPVDPRLMTRLSE